MPYECRPPSLYAIVSALLLRRVRGGKILGLPVYQYSPNVYTIRRDWLAKLGLQAPETLEEARAVWRALTFRIPTVTARTTRAATA